MNRVSHPGFRPPLKANDIGLIQMNRPVEFTPYVRPACLNTVNVKQGQNTLASGFGKLSFGKLIDFNFFIFCYLYCRCRNWK